MVVTLLINGEGETTQSVRAGEYFHQDHVILGSQPPKYRYGDQPPEIPQPHLIVGP